MPDGTAVDSENVPSEADANPEPESAAVQPMATSVGCQFPSAAPQFTAGAVVSIETVNDCGAVVRPAQSWLQKLTVCTPSEAM